MTTEIEGKIKKALAGNRKLDKIQRGEIRMRIEEMTKEVEEGDREGAEDSAQELHVILEFLYLTKELTLEEYNGMCSLVNGIADEGRKRWEEEDEEI